MAEDDNGMSFAETDTAEGRAIRAKRRDACYIPRPPNAFILFRSSFIREHKVTANVEGNHSNLSKIIGKYWKALPKSEHDAWEAKALQAQLDHRRRFPDWRFSPGANAAANAKTKRYVVDSGGGDPGGGRMRSGSMRIRGAKDPPDEHEHWEVEDEQDVGHDESDYEQSLRRRKGKSRAHARVKPKPRSTRRHASLTTAERIDKITDLLVQGKKGIELEKVLEEWEKDRSVPVSSAPSGPVPSSLSMLSPAMTRSSTPPLSPQAHGTKRSLSAPASDMRVGMAAYTGSYHRPYGQAQPAQQGGGIGMKKQHRSTASGEAERINKERGRRETVSLPLALTHSGHRVRCNPGLQQPGTEVGPAGPCMTQVMSFGATNATASIAPPPSGITTATTQFPGLGFYYSTPPAAAGTYANTSRWPLHSLTADVNKAYDEPIREGSFEQTHDDHEYEYGYQPAYGVYPASAGAGYGEAYAEMGRRYSEFFEHGMSGEAEREGQASRSISMINPPTTVVGQDAAPPGLRFVPNTAQTNVDTDGIARDMTADARSILGAPAPSPIPASSFSSLMGWDGTGGEREREREGGGETGYGQGERRGQAQAWFGWGRMQSVGLGGGEGG